MNFLTINIRYKYLWLTVKIRYKYLWLTVNIRYKIFHSFGYNTYL